MEFKIDGLAELQKKLREFGPKIAGNEQRNATRAAAAVFRDAVRQTAPVRSGTLKANIVVNARRSREGPDKVTYSVRLKPGKKLKYANTSLNRRLRRVGKKYTADSAAFYGRFLEFGTSKMQPRPFMRPAFGPNVRPALEAFRARMAKAVTDAAKS